MRVPKKALFAFSFIVLILLISTYFFLFSSYSNEKINCQSKNDNAHGDCGLIVSSKDGTHNVIGGIIKGKKDVNGILYITVITSNAQERSIIQQISLPSSEDVISIGIPNQSGLNYKLYKPGEAYVLLSIGQIVRIDLPVPSKKILENGKSKSPNLLLSKCFSTNDTLIKYLKKSSFSNLLSYRLTTLVTGCTPTTTQITILE